MLFFVSYVAEQLRKVKDGIRLPDLAPPQTLSVQEVPEPFHEPGIVTGYRTSHCTPLQALVSVFAPHNETLNVWSHFLPGLYFLHLATTFSTPDAPVDPFLLPFACYLYTACGYMFISALAHTFSCVSVLGRYLCFFFDYIGVSMYSWGAALLCFSYTFPPYLMDNWLAQLFLPLAALWSLTATFCSCQSRFCETKGMRTLLRLAAYMVPAVWIGLFLALWVLQCVMQDDLCGSDAVVLHVAHVGFLIAGATFYGSHFPERLAPGNFDTVGHSHTLFHVCVAIATYFESEAAFIVLETRRPVLEAQGWMPSPAWITHATPILVVVQLLGVAVFTIAMHRRLQRNSLTTHAKTS